MNEDINYQEEIVRLQEENKTLKLENENLSVDKGNLENEIKNLREWNNKLFRKVGFKEEKRNEKDETILSMDEIERRFNNG